jgi:hypothetical protein
MFWKASSRGPCSLAARPPAGSPGSHLPTRTSQRLIVTSAARNLPYLLLPRLHALCLPVASTIPSKPLRPSTRPALTRQRALRRFTSTSRSSSTSTGAPASWREAIEIGSPSIAIAVALCRPRPTAPFVSVAVVTLWTDTTFAHLLEVQISLLRIRRAW